MLPSTIPCQISLGISSKRRTRISISHASYLFQIMTTQRPVCSTSSGASPAQAVLLAQEPRIPACFHVKVHIIRLILELVGVQMFIKGEQSSGFTTAKTHLEMFFWKSGMTRTFSIMTVRLYERSQCNVQWLSKCLEKISDISESIKSQISRRKRLRQ